MTSKALKAGHSIEVQDAVITGTAAVRGWIVATRNTGDSINLGVPVFDPWKDKL